MTRRLAAYAAMVLGLALPISANAGSDTKASDAAKEKKVCRTVAVTGSKIPTRTCKTQAEWDAQSVAAQAQFRVDMQDRRNRGGQ